MVSGRKLQFLGPTARRPHRNVHRAARSGSGFQCTFLEVTQNPEIRRISIPLYGSIFWINVH